MSLNVLRIYRITYFGRAEEIVTTIKQDASAIGARVMRGATAAI